MKNLVLSLITFTFLFTANAFANPTEISISGESGGCVSVPSFAQSVKNAKSLTASLCSNGVEQVGNFVYEVKQVRGACGNFEVIIAKGTFICEYKSSQRAPGCRRRTNYTCD